MTKMMIKIMRLDESTNFWVMLNKRVEKSSGYFGVVLERGEHASGRLESSVFFGHVALTRIAECRDILLLKRSTTPTENFFPACNLVRNFLFR